MHETEQYRAKDQGHTNPDVSGVWLFLMRRIILAKEKYECM